MGESIRQPKHNDRFRDISLSLQKDFMTGDILVRKDADAVKDQVRNLILLTLGEKEFSPNVGGSLYQLLFDSFSIANKGAYEAHIKSQIETYEPRVADPVIQITRTNSNTLDVFCQFSIVGTQTIQDLTVTVERTR